jgi:hypothetical protein
MKDTGFAASPEQRARQATVHQREADGSLTPLPFEAPSEREFLAGGGGLYSTASDYLAFLQALLQGGGRILKPETVALMGENHVGGLQAGILKTNAPLLTNDVDFFPGQPVRWGLGYMLTPEPAVNGRGAGSVTWAGLFNTNYWLDPKQRVAGLIMTQILPFADVPTVALWRVRARCLCRARPTVGGLRAFFAKFVAVVLPLVTLAACVEGVGSDGSGSDFIVVSDFAVPEGAIHLDTSFGFSLNRGAPGVPPQQRAASVGRAVGFLVSDAVTERLRGLGYDAASTTDPAPAPGKRALIVTGRFRAIDEGYRRSVGHENSAVLVTVQVTAQVPGRGVEPVQIFAVDSRSAPRVAMTGAATRRETGVDADATRVGAEIARVVAEIARRNNWVPARR